MAQPSTGKALSPSTNLAQIANIVSAMTNLRCSSMVSGLKTHEFSFEPLQSIFGGLVGPPHTINRPTYACCSTRVRSAWASALSAANAVLL